MKAEKECRACCARKAAGLIKQYAQVESRRSEMEQEIEQLVSNAPEEISAPELMSRIMECLEAEIPVNKAYREPKQRYNRLLLEREQEIFQSIKTKQDPLYGALQYALTGNYIDFGAMDEVSEKKLYKLLAEAENRVLDDHVYDGLKKRLSWAKSLCYITDNAGEAVLDKICIRILKELYPKLSVTVIVRGAPVLNDATLEDVRDAGFYELEDIRILPNGTSISGTVLTEVSKDVCQAIRCADLCIAKGQGNFETLYGCGYPVYYLFLCKCQTFIQRFHVEQFAGVLIAEDVCNIHKK